MCCKFFNRPIKGGEEVWRKEGEGIKVDLFFFSGFYIGRGKEVGEGEREKGSLIMETIEFGERGIRIYGKIRATLE